MHKDPQNECEAYNNMMDISNAINSMLTKAKSSTHPLNLLTEVMEKLAQAQQAIFEAQRLTEKIFQITR